MKVEGAEIEAFIAEYRPYIEQENTYLLRNNVLTTYLFTYIKKNVGSSNKINCRISFLKFFCFVL